MATSVRFNLKSSTSDSRLIMIVFRYGRGKLYMSTKMSVNVSDWDNRKQRVIGVSDTNEQLNRLERFILTTHGSNNIISLSDLKNRVSRFIAGESQEQGSQVVDFIDFYLLKMKNKKNFSLNQRKKWTSVKNHLVAYDPKVIFEDITVRWLNGFVDYFYDQDYSANTVQTYIKKLKRIYGLANDLEVHSGTFDKDRKFTTKGAKTKNKIRINNKQINKLINYPLTGHLKHVRDTYIIGCLTGLRFQSWASVDASTVTKKQGVMLLPIYTKKVGKMVYIPVDDRLMEFIKSTELVNCMQHFNREIKNVFRLVFPDLKFDRIYNMGGVNHHERAFVADHVSSHSARRTFATNAYESGMPLYLISAILGHSTEKQTLEYMDLALEEMSMEFALRSAENVVRLEKKKKLQVI